MDDSAYADNIEKYAYRLFDKKDIHIYRSVMSHDKYIEMISGVDIAIFDFEHQAAFGNIILLLYLGKQLYLSPTGIMGKGLHSEGVQVFNCRDLKKLDISAIKSINVSPNNTRYAEKLLDKKYIASQWINAFDDILS